MGDDGPRPFKAVLDVGLKRTTTGSRSFGVMKGAADGGLLIPHNEKRFPGFDRESKELDAEVHKEHIMGEHVAEYMRLLEEENPGKYEQQFARYIKAGVNADGLGEMYEKIHAAIRAKPCREEEEDGDQGEAPPPSQDDLLAAPGPCCPEEEELLRQEGTGGVNQMRSGAGSFAQWLKCMFCDE